MEGLPRLPHRQFPGDGAAAGGPGDGERGGGQGARRGAGGLGVTARLPQGEPATWMTFLISYWGEQIGRKVRKITDW